MAIAPSSVFLHGANLHPAVASFRVPKLGSRSCHRRMIFTPVHPKMSQNSISGEARSRDSMEGVAPPPNDLLHFGDEQMQNENEELDDVTKSRDSMEGAGSVAFTPTRDVDDIEKQYLYTDETLATTEGKDGDRELSSATCSEKLSEGIADKLRRMEELVMKNDDGKSATDYSRRAGLFAKSNEVFSSCKRDESV